MVFGKHYSKYYLKYWYTYILGIAALIFVDYMQLEIPDIVGQIIDGIQYHTLTQEILLGFVHSLGVVALCVFLGRFLWRICIFGNGIKIEADIRNEMFEHMEKLSQTYYSKNKTGEMMALYTNDLGLIRRSFGAGTMMLVDALALGILAFMKMFRLMQSINNYWLLVICVVPLIFVSAFASYMRTRISKRVKKNLEAYSELSDYCQENFLGISVIKAYVKEKRKQELFADYNQKNMDTTLGIVKEQIILSNIVNAVMSLITIGIIFLGGYYIYNEMAGLNIGLLVTINAYFTSLIWPVMAVGDLINLRGQSKAGERRINALLDTVPTINDELVTDETKTLVANDFKGDIKFNGVTFNYPGSSVNVLENVSFEIKSGELVGIMGATGCGKSTIVELMLRLYNLEENKIMVDGIDIMTIPVKTVREVMAYVPQESFLFKQTIDENIAFAFDEIDTEKTHASAESAGLKNDIDEFTNGFDTVLGERGVTVSGGQKQRICIARALIKDAPILILDDSLSAVDTITEKFILGEIKRLRENKTTIIIAHRISTLENLDKIIVVEDGKISDVGTPDYLKENNEIYSREVHLQELEKELEEN